MASRMVARHDNRVGSAPWEGGSVEHCLAAMTPEERARDAIELVERVWARLAALRTIEHELKE
jgi:hypothetical protein